MDWIFYLLLIIGAIVLIGLPAYFAKLLNERMLIEFPERQSFVWGYFIVNMTVLIGLGVISFGIFEYRLVTIVWGVVTCVFGIFLYFRNRWVWLAFSVLQLNPIILVINVIYVKNRWVEMRPKKNEEEEQENSSDRFGLEKK